MNKIPRFEEESYLKKMQQRIRRLLILLIPFFLFSSCAGVPAATQKPTDSGNTENITIVTTIFPLYDWVKNITGRDDIVYLDESGTDLHSFEPTAQDIITLAHADVFIYIGGESDKWVDGAVQSAKNPELVTLSLLDKTGALEEETAEGMEALEEDEEALDEHIWLSLRKAQLCVTLIADTLAQKDAANAQTYRANAQQYSEQLAALDRQFAAAVQEAERKTLLFADRFPFRYFTEDYGIAYYAAFPGCSAESEASFETITFLMEKTKELNLPYILVLESSDGKLAAAISQNTSAGVLTLNSCQSITGDDIDSGITYLSLMQENLQILTEALN